VIREVVGPLPDSAFQEEIVLTFDGTTVRYWGGRRGHGDGNGERRHRHSNAANRNPAETETGRGLASES
jgi:hypothetical protein